MPIPNPSIVLFEMVRFDRTGIPMPIEGPSRLLVEMSPTPSISIAAADG
jgi:hypothetical protein